LLLLIVVVVTFGFGLRLRWLFTLRWFGLRLRLFDVGCVWLVTALRLRCRYTRYGYVVRRLRWLLRFVTVVGCYVCVYVYVLLPVGCYVDWLILLRCCGLLLVVVVVV